MTNTKNYGQKDSEVEAPRLWFAHSLRGIAAMSVLFSHLYWLFWERHADIAVLAHFNPLPQISLPIYGPAINQLATVGINFGVWGVALFFLISGFVIPFSLKKMTIGRFLVARCFRLYPTYAIGLATSCLCLYFYTMMTGQMFPYSLQEVLGNFSLQRDWLWLPSIDGVNWTLEVEVKFYMVCAVLAWINSLDSNKAIISLCAALCMFNVFCSSLYAPALQNSLHLYKMMYIISTSAIYIPFMFIGTCLNNFWNDNWSKQKTIRAIGFLYVVFLVAVHYGPNSGQINSLVVSYTLALIIFSATYYYRNKLKYSKVLNYFSDISYPIYVIHPILGYISLRVEVSMLGNYASLLLTTLIVILIASLVHFTIEMPTNRIGKKVGARYIGI